MHDVLQAFIDQSPYEAGHALFAHLNVPLNASTAQPMSLADVLGPFPATHRAIFDVVSDTYFLGQVSDQSYGLFREQQVALEEALQQAERGYEGILVFAVTLNNALPASDFPTGKPTRGQLSALVRALNRTSKRMPVVLLARYSHADRPLLTFATTERVKYKQAWREGEKLGKISLLKDIDLETPHAGHLRILEDLRLKPDVNSFEKLYKQWHEVLDVEVLNKKFYKELSYWYFWTKRETIFPEAARVNSDDPNAISVIRLITRMIFVWFLKEKGLIGEALFDEAQLAKLLKYEDDNDSTFFKAVLQNLFFATLNQEMNTPDQPGKRKFRGEKRQHYNITNLYRYRHYFNDPEAALDHFVQIPFLNGGLFECLDKRDDSGKVVRIDGFSDREDNPIKVPDALFFSDWRDIDLNDELHTKNKKYKTRGLIRTFNSYKFTVDENTPLEQEIALDPELLGKVFENLLAAYNPETETTARKLTGSFYTPRHIVDYMVDESLKAYLETTLIQHREKETQSKTPPVILYGVKKPDSAEEAVQEEFLAAEKESIRSHLEHLFSYIDESHRFDETDAVLLIEAIDNLKIIDPACGSGAFPIGVLQRLVFILGKLDPGNEGWKNRQIARAEAIEDATIQQRTLADIEDAFERNALDYGRKLYLIENCIYGVDIQPIAVQIAKLRCFISLIVNEQIDDSRPNRGIRPLPNLETKFVAADALMSIEKQLALRDPKIDELENQLEGVRHRHFNARTPRTKKKYRKEDAKLRAEISTLLKAGGFSKDTADQLAGWNPYDQNTSAKFFSREWMFGIRDGFDVVIGNPPYIRQEKIKHLKPGLRKRYTCYKGTADLYVYFFEAGIKMLNARGILTYISSNKFFRTAYGDLLRDYLAKKTTVRHIIDFGDADVFTAIAYPCILVLKKESPPKAHDAQALDWQKGDYALDDFVAVFHKDQFPLRQHRALNKGGWRLLTSKEIWLLDMLRKVGSTLDEVTSGKYYYGIKTGYNKAFVVNRETRDRLIAEDASSEGIIKPFLQGRDVKRWDVDFDDQFLIKIESSANKHHPWSGKSKDEAERIFSRTYPSIYHRFQCCRKKLIKRYDQGKYFWELRACAYWQEFEKPKIIYPNICRRNEFAWDEKQFYTNQKAFIISNASKSLLAILNSSVVMWLFDKLLPKLQNGYYEPSAVFMKDFPIAEVSNSAPLEALVDYILFLTSQELETSEHRLMLAYFEQVIDGAVFELYFEDSIKAAGKDVLRHLQDLPELRDEMTDEEKWAVVSETFKRLYNPEHPVRNALFYMDSVPEVKIIRGKA